MTKTPLLVVTGTGTEIGKTHLASALVGTWVRRLRSAGHPYPRVAGIKPIESGVTVGDATGSDGRRLEALATFHVKHPPPYLFARPVSPHLAARDEGRSIDVPTVIAWVDAVREEADAVVLELAGGLFSPLGGGRTNVDLARAVSPTACVLVAPDRLGVLHDVGATSRAAEAAGLRVHGVLLSSPAEADASTGTNTRELADLLPGIPIETALRRTSAELSEAPSLDAFLDAVLGDAVLGNVISSERTT